MRPGVGGVGARSTGGRRDEALRVYTGVLAPTGSASLVEERLLRALGEAAA